MKKILVLLSALVIVFGVVATASATAVTWNGNMYEVVLFADGALGWEDARLAAKAMGDGWDLATITSADELAFIAGYLGIPNDRTQLWIGGYQDKNADSQADASTNALGWNWVTNEEWDYTAWLEDPHLQPDDWVEPGMPADEHQRYLALDSDLGAWGFDDNFNYLGIMRGYIAEKSNPVPEPTTLLLLGSGLAGLGVLGRRKVFKK